MITRTIWEIISKNILRTTWRMIMRTNRRMVSRTISGSNLGKISRTDLMTVWGTILSWRTIQGKLGDKMGNELGVYQC